VTKQKAVVGLVSPRYAPAVGGVERCVEALACGLARRGILVEVITTDPTGRLPAVEERDGVLVRRFPTIANDGVYFLSPKLGGWLLRNASRFSLLHAHSYHTPLPLLAALAGYWSHIPLVLTLYYHGTGHTPFRRALHVPYRFFGKWSVQQAQRVICVSETERKQIRDSFAPDITTEVIPPGVEVARLMAARPHTKANGKHYVLSVGRLEHYKQTERLVKASPYLPPEYEIVIIGDGPARLHVEQLAMELNVSKRVRLLGHLPDSELLAWYRTADVFVTLSQKESFGMTLLEAAVAGSAVVASDISAHREVASYVPTKNVSFVSSACSPTELAKIVERAAGGERATDVKSWPLPTWEKAVDGTLACYHAVQCES